MSAATPGARAAIATVAFASLCAPARAEAELLALRGPDLGRSVVLVEGAPESSRAVWITPTVALALDQRWPYDAFALGVGTRRTLVGGARGWALDAQLGAGFSVTTLLPGLALTLAPSAQARVRGERAWFSLGLSAPMAARLSAPQEIRLPVALELLFALRAGPVWLGVTGSTGATFAPSANAALLVHAGVYLAIPLADPANAR